MASKINKDITERDGPSEERRESEEGDAYLGWHV